MRKCCETFNYLYVWLFNLNAFFHVLTRLTGQSWQRSLNKYCRPWGSDKQSRRYMQVSWKWNRTNWATTSSINWNGHVRRDNLLRSQRQRVAVRRVRFIVDKTPKYRLCKRQKQVLRHVVAQLKFLLCIQACGINHKPIHGIMNTKGGLWLFGNSLYQSPSFVKNEKWPGPNHSWMNWPFPHNVHRVPLCRYDTVV